VLRAYSDGIATGQHVLKKVLELEATLGTESAWLADSLFLIGISSCGRGDADTGISLVSAARRMYREYGIVEWAFEHTVLGRIEKSARAALGDQGYEATIRSGEALARDEAIALALSITTD
jgi:hypothetical protein